MNPPPTGILHFLNEVPLAGFMTCAATGYTLGKIPWRGISIGPAGGTLFAALLLGALGVEPPTRESGTLSIGFLGFALFIYSVGFEAGPGFVRSFLDRSGWKAVWIGILVNLTALFAAWAWSKAWDLPAAAAAGMLSGALTSAPTYATALMTGLEGAPLACAFALTYPFGLVGLVFMVQLLPGWLHPKWPHPSSDHAQDAESPSQRPRDMEVRAFEIGTQPVAGKRLADLTGLREKRCRVLTLLRSGHVLPALADTVMEKGDRILVRGPLENMATLGGLLGTEVAPGELLQQRAIPRRIQVRRQACLGKPLQELTFPQRYGCLIERIRRGREWMEPHAELILQSGDLLEVSGPPDGLAQLARQVGRFETDSTETHLGVYAAGILVGLLIGHWEWSPAGLHLSLGPAGGLLIAGLGLGWLESQGWEPARVPGSARRFVRDLGILMFIGQTGLEAGTNLLTGLPGIGWTVMIGGAAVTSIAVLLPLLFALKPARMKPVHAWGSVCGGMTSSAALNAVRQASGSAEVTVSYAAAYAVASVLAAIAGPLLVALLEKGG